MAEEIEIGGIVVLKSGSPPMTVDEIDDGFGATIVSCSWYDGKKIVKDSFPATSLKKSGP
jgi:uncharacterized protein YodC (DUF2158 family)